MTCLELKRKIENFITELHDDETSNKDDVRMYFNDLLEAIWKDEE
jgi:hypothetical protein